MLQASDVETALDAMRAGQALPSSHPFRFLTSIAQRLQSPEALQGEDALQVAVFRLLGDLITRHRQEIQARIGITGGTEPADDFRVGNRELEAWSVLYFRYVDIQRNLNVQDLVRLTNQIERTIRRREKLGITRLTQVLIELEQKARLENARLRMQLAIPPLPQPARLSGAESLLAGTLDVLCHAQSPHHVALHGPLGIGKKTLAVALAQSMIRDDRIRDLLWIPCSAGPDDLLIEMAARLGLQGDNPIQLLRAYLASYPVLVVLDNAESLFADPVAAEKVLAHLNSAYVLAISQDRAPAHLWLYEVVVPEFTREQAFEYLAGQVSRRPAAAELLPERFEAIWQVAGGNPLALSLLLGAALSNQPMPAYLVKHKKIGPVCTWWWERFSADERRVLLAALVFAQGSLSGPDGEDLLGTDAAAVDQGLARLVDAALLNRRLADGVVRYTLPPVIGTFLQERARQGMEIVPGEPALDYLAQLCTRQAGRLTNHPQAETGITVLRLAHDLGLTAGLRLDLARRLAMQIMEAGLWGPWHDQLLALDRLSWPAEEWAWLSLMLGTCLRWLGRLEQARVRLNHALDHFQQPDPSQADVLVELGVIARYQGRWDDAFRLLHRASDLYEDHGAFDGRERCVHEIAQADLDLQQSERALSALNRLPVWSARTWSIAAQAYLLRDQLEAALDAADRALALLPPQHPNQGRAAVALGQIYDAMNKPVVAARYTKIGIDLLEQARDIVGYARALNNLAVAYLKHPPADCPVSMSEITRLLTQAMRIQEDTGDELGLAKTRHNLATLSEPPDSRASRSLY